MTTPATAPPIRVRRRPDPVDGAHGAWIRRKWPWGWACLIPDCEDREPYQIPFGAERTQPAALTAGLAHLDTHQRTP